MPLKFMAFLPPMEESTCARSVVGTATRFIPLLYTDDANPVKSPTVPPPIYDTVSDLSIFKSISFFNYKS